MSMPKTMQGSRSSCTCSAKVEGSSVLPERGMNKTSSAQVTSAKIKTAHMATCQLSASATILPSEVETIIATEYDA